MYTVIYSKSPYLLARMATDLQMEGWEDYKGNHDKFHPFTGTDQYTSGFGKCEWMEVLSARLGFNFHNHECWGSPIRHTLTSRNYLKVLGAILNRLP